MQEIKKGDGYKVSAEKKPAVAMAQTGLNARGFVDENTSDKTACAADGIFGPGTEEACKDFQASVDLEPDGVIGLQTWAALEGSSVELDLKIEDTKVEDEKFDGFYVASYLEYNQDTGRYVAYTTSGLSLGVVYLSHLAAINQDFYDAVSGTPIRRVTNETAADETEMVKGGVGPNFPTLNKNGIPVEATSGMPLFDSAS